MIFDFCLRHSGQIKNQIGTLPLWKLQFDFNVHARRQIQAHERVNRFAARFQHINESFVRANFKLFARIFVNECAANDREFFDFSRQRYGANDGGAGTFCRFHNLFYRLVKHAVVVTFKPNANFLSRHYRLSIVVSYPLWSFVI